MSDASANPLKLGEVVWLKNKFENSVLKVLFIIAEKLAVHEIIVNPFMNRQLSKYVAGTKY